MEDTKHPTYGNGKICYIEIPAIDLDRSAVFYNMDAPEITARFSDPAGNVFGLYQQPAKKIK